MNIYDYLLWTEFGFAIFVFIILFFVSAPYGKFLRGGWGFTIPARYAWLIMEMPALLVITWYFFKTGSWDNPVKLVFIIVWQSHYFFRTIIYPFIMGGGDKPYPFLLVIFAMIFNGMNGAINGYFIFETGDYLSNWFISIPFLLGIAMFYGGYIINKQSDFILKDLRRKHETYQVPRGGMFRFISNPHYFGEILQWLGWAVMTYSVAGLAFACFTFANLAPRAISSHKWYREHFQDYPERRKALIPFIW